MPAIGTNKGDEIYSKADAESGDLGIFWKIFRLQPCYPAAWGPLPQKPKKSLKGLIFPLDFPLDPSVGKIPDPSG